MERLSIAMNDIISAIERSQTLVKRDDTWEFCRYQQGDTEISPWMLHAMITTNIQQVTIALVSWHEMEQVWNDESIHVVLVHDEDEYIVLKFGPLTPNGRNEYGSEIVVGYDPKQGRWSTKNIYLVSVMQTFGF